MHILSFDVGMKNISYVYIEINDLEDWNILKWGIFSIHGIVENDNKSCYYDETNLEYIKTILKKEKLKNLTDICNNYSLLEKDKKYKKYEIIEILDKFTKKINIKLSLSEITKRISKHFDIIFNDILKGDKIDSVIIENQPCLKNPTMKSMQIAINTYFVIRMHVDYSTIKKSCEIAFVSASTKMNFCKKTKLIDKIPKGDYKKTKKLSIEVVDKLLNENKNIEFKHKDYFHKQDKKDDLSDVVLQAFGFFLNK